MSTKNENEKRKEKLKSIILDLLAQNKLYDKHIKLSTIRITYYRLTILMGLFREN